MMPRAAGLVGAAGGARSARRSPGLGRGQECAEVTRPRADGSTRTRDRACVDNAHPASGGRGQDKPGPACMR